MRYVFFFASIAVIWAVFLVLARFKRITTESLFVGVLTVIYSLVFDIVFGEYFNLYYYISPKYSVLYILLAAVLVYPPLNIIYTLFLPGRRNLILAYTLVWIAFMMAFELLSFRTGTIVLTGWKVFPWSIVTYIVTYLWVYNSYVFFSKRYWRRFV
jgi:hypothetical protein